MAHDGRVMTWTDVGDFYIYPVITLTFNIDSQDKTFLQK